MFKIFVVKAMMVTVILGEWNKLQALFLNECPQAYYVHELQLALVAAVKEVYEVYEFFYVISLIVKAVTFSKHRDELQVAHIQDMAFLAAIDEVGTGTCDDQIGTLKEHAKLEGVLTSVPFILFLVCFMLLVRF